MSIPIALQLDARRDLVEAALWYEEQKAGLSEELFAELRTTLSAVAERPKSFPIKRKTTRRALMNRFPYAVYFSEEKDYLLIKAIIHTSRSTRFVSKRITDR